MTPEFIFTTMTLVCLAYGLYMFFGALRNWGHFNRATKRIDLIEIFGVYGRLLYVLIGFLIILASTFALFAYHNIGPLAPYLSFDKRN